MAAGGLGHRQEHCQRRADHEYGRPRGAGHVLADPDPAQQQDEVQLSDKDRLDHRQLADVQGQGLERERAHRSDGAEQPQRLRDADTRPGPTGVRRQGTGEAWP